jgi:hypothetical protein
LHEDFADTCLFHLVSRRTVDDRLAILVDDPSAESSEPAYFMLITWQNAQASSIRGYRYVRNVIRDAEIAAV